MYLRLAIRVRRVPGLCLSGVRVTIREKILDVGALSQWVEAETAQKRPASLGALLTCYMPVTWTTSRARAMRLLDCRGEFR